MTKFGYPPSVTSRDNTARSGSTVQLRPGTQTVSVNRENKPSGQPSLRKADRDKKWPLKGWETDYSQDDGITGWMKRQTLLESKKGTKKRSPRLESETYFSVKHNCPGIEDTELFQSESLHAVFCPKPKPSTEDINSSVKLRYTNKAGTDNPAGFDERDIDYETDTAVNTFKVSKSTSTHDGLSDRRSRSVQDLTKLQTERSNTCIKIKRLLKFSKKDRRPLKPEDDEDEGYSSKTSSAETKQEPESDGEESGADRLERQRMFSSMVDLSELPSQFGDEDGGNSNSITNAKVIGESVTSRVKFSYTHQPTILQLPDPDVKLNHDNLRIEKRIESEDTSWSYAKLKRDKELNRCYKPDLIHPVEDSSIYDIDNLKPVTLVLRKISIQNADDNEPIVSKPGIVERNSERTVSPTRNHSSMGSMQAPRVGSALSREGSLSRNGSVKFGAGSPMPILVGSPAPVPGTPRNVSPHHNLTKSPTPRKNTRDLQRVGSAVSQRELKHRSNNVRDVRVVSDNKPKEPMWNHQYSYIDRQSIDRQATNYCIGDLLPAVDKNIYTNNTVKSKYGKSETERQQEELTTTELLDMNISSVDDGYILLKKGMDLLTGTAEKPTLGPPAFRPNQTRHPLMRNVTVIIDNKSDYGNKYGPVSGLTRSKTLRVHSDKGPRYMADEDKEAQKKLKEAFSKFYKNRPKEIGKEFRKMETMWQT